ncbi:MAG: hypothetical protein K5648_06715 [Erysipelotrichaceae bacterium]|nr:hypothetical protein [Erysipelotrichaceae bacterium]
MKKIFLIFLVSFLMASSFLCDVHADVGPKPSVTVYLDDVPEGPYFVTLFSDREVYGPWRKTEASEVKEAVSDKDKAFASFAAYEDRDGYCFLGNMSEEMEGKGTFSWTYYPPDSFKVAVYSLKEDRLYLSDICEREAFDSYFHARIRDGKLLIEEESHLGNTLLKTLLRALATVAVELALAYLFGYRSKKHILSILAVNLITQILLNVFLMLGDYFGGMLVWMVLFPIGELTVIVLEMILYIALLRKEKKGKLIFYVFLANLLSAALTFFTFLGAHADL